MLGTRIIIRQLNSGGRVHEPHARHYLHERVSDLFRRDVLFVVLSRGKTRARVSLSNRRLATNRRGYTADDFRLNVIDVFRV